MSDRRLLGGNRVFLYLYDLEHEFPFAKKRRSCVLNELTHDEKAGIGVWLGLRMDGGIGVGFWN